MNNQWLQFTTKISIPISDSLPLHVQYNTYGFIYCYMNSTSTISAVSIDCKAKQSSQSLAAVNVDWVAPRAQRAPSPGCQWVAPARQPPLRRRPLLHPALGSRTFATASVGTPRTSVVCSPTGAGRLKDVQSNVSTSVLLSYLLVV